MSPSMGPRMRMRHLCAAVGRGSVIASVALGVLGGAGALAYADPTPGGSRPDLYPELRYFTRIDAGPYLSPTGEGAWFVTAQGLRCGIWFRGSFGCTGPIPGAPAGVDKIGWITGDTRVHYDWTMAVRFPPPGGALTIPPLSYIESEGTSCGTTLDGSTYCERGPWRLLITPTRTWLNR
jgi:hypothetical protein